MLDPGIWAQGCRTAPVRFSDAALTVRNNPLRYGTCQVRPAAGSPFTVQPRVLANRKMPKLLRLCLIFLLALVYNRLSNAIYCRCGPTRSPRADFSATLQHLSASANQPHTYLATQHPHPHGRTRSQQSCVDSPTILLRIPRMTTVSADFFPFSGGGGALLLRSGNEAAKPEVSRGGRPEICLPTEAS
jgi:hypothetical protein